MKANLLACAMTVLLAAFNSRAVTLEEISGVYLGKSRLTIESPGFDNYVERYDQLTVIETNGTMMIHRLAKVRGQFQLVESRIYYLPPVMADCFVDIPSGIQTCLRLNGRHLSMTIQQLLTPEGVLTLETQGRRIGSLSEILTP